MKNMLIKIRDSLAGNVVGAIATAVWSAVCVAALFLLRSAASLYATDPLATTAICFSMLVLGATAGYLVCYAIDRQETRKRRRALANLPAFQAAICWEGYEAEGTFFTGFSKDDCKVLSDRGFI